MAVKTMQQAMDDAMLAARYHIEPRTLFVGRCLKCPWSSTLTNHADATEQARAHVREAHPPAPQKEGGR